MKRLVLLLLASSAIPTFAVQTETVTYDTYSDFNKGDPKGVAITDKGLLQLASL